MTAAPRRWARLLAALAGAAGGCATIDTPVVNENYGSPPSRAERRARSDNAMDHVVRGEDPCADEKPARPSPDRPAIDSVVHVRPGDSPDDCTISGPGLL